MPRVERLLQHALIEFQPAQLTIDVEARVGESGIGLVASLRRGPDHTDHGRPSSGELRTAGRVTVE